MLRRLSSRSVVSVSPTMHHKPESSAPRCTASTTQSTPKLPRLPVPPLRKTLDGYLKSIQPFLIQDELEGGPSFDSVYGERVKLVEEFEQGVGPVLQERLIALDRNSPNNWLDDNFWLKKAYHEWRAPVLINSNWWLAFKDDVKIPETARLGLSDFIAGISPWQVRRAASMVYRTLEFKDKLANQTANSEITRTGIWLKASTRKMFSVCRVPVQTCDILSPEPPLSSSDARRIIVLIHDFFYTIEVYNKTWTKIDAAQIERQLWACVRDVETRLSKNESPVRIGILSADHRDRWTENYLRLQSISPINRETFRRIHHSLFCLSLDHFASPNSLSLSQPRLPDSHSDLSDHLHLIRSSYNARNRFFDKPYTLIVDPLARSGATGEHSPVDALVPSIVGEYAIVEGICEKAFDARPEDVARSVTAPNEIGWERLQWSLDDKIKDECLLAEERAKEIIADSDNDVFWFQGYGADWIKDGARLSPDAYIQMALQLAWYRTRGTFTATYETALTRLFHNGRTETIRTLSTDSCNWVRAMTDDSTSNVRRLELLKRAILTHTHRTREAATGKGIDRHLLGLQMMLRPEQGERAKLFTDELFQRSQMWKLSTSGLSAGHHFKGTGFGSPYHDGYGINYLLGPDMVKFGIESKYSFKDTSTASFITAVAVAMNEMKSICMECLGTRL